MEQLKLFSDNVVGQDCSGVKVFLKEVSLEGRCPYCQKERDQVNLFGSVDDEFSYSCVVCNLEFLNWLSGKEKHDPYLNPSLQKAFERELKRDRDQDDVPWKSHLKTIAERSEAYKTKGSK